MNTNLEMFGQGDALLRRPRSAATRRSRLIRLRIVRICALTVFLGGAAVASMAAGERLQPFAIAADDPNILATPDVKTTMAQGRVSVNRVMGMSVDRHFTSGVYSSQIGKGRIESYPVDEFMYFIKGDMTLISADGSMTRVKAGEAVQVPRAFIPH